MVASKQNRIVNLDEYTEIFMVCALCLATVQSQAGMRNVNV